MKIRAESLSVAKNERIKPLLVTFRAQSLIGAD